MSASLRLLVALAAATQLATLPCQAQDESLRAAEQKLREQLIRPVVPLPPTPFWRHALLTPSPDRISRQAAELAATARSRNSAQVEAGALRIAAEASLHRPSDVDKALRLAWNAADRLGDPEGSAEAHLLIAYRSYAAGDGWIAQNHAASARSIWQATNMPEQALRALLLQALSATPLGSDEPLIELDGNGLRVHKAEMMQFVRQWMVRTEDASEEGGRLVTHRVRAELGDGVINARTKPWLDLLEGYQLYAASDREMATRAWQQVAQADTARATVRGLAYLALVWLQMEALARGDAKPEAVATNAKQALDRARAMFERDGIVSGAGQTWLLSAELNYLLGRADDGYGAAAEAVRVFGRIERPEGAIQAHLLQLIGETRLKRLKQATAAAQAGFEYTRSTGLSGRAAPPIVARLLEESKRLPLLVGSNDPPSPATLTDARTFLAWSQTSGEPIARLLALSALSKALAQAGYLEDAVYYDELRRQGHAAYVAAVPLDERLRRAALLDYDLLSAESAGDLGLTKFNDAAFEKLRKSVEALVMLSARQASDQGVAGAVGLTSDQVEAQAKREMQRINGALDRLRDAVKAFRQAFDKDRREAVRRLFDVRRALEAISEATSGADVSVRNSTSNITATSNDGTAEADITARVELHYVSIAPERSEAERMHRSAFLDYEFTILAASLLRDEKRALEAAAALASFYSLYRDHIAPPEGIGFPTAIGNGLAFDVGATLDKPATQVKRSQLIAQALQEHKHQYSERLLTPYKDKDGARMDAMAAIGSEPLMALRENFDADVKVLQNEVQERRDGDRRRVQIRHSANIRFEAKENAPMFARPPPNRRPDLEPELQTLITASTPLRAAPEVRWTALVGTIASLDSLNAISNQLVGTSLAAMIDQNTVFGALLTPGAIALSRARTDDLIFPPGTATFESAVAALKAHPGTSEVVRSFATLATRSASRLPSDASSLADSIGDLLNGLRGAAADLDIADYLRAGVGPAADYPELTFAILGDVAGQRAAFEQVVAARNSRDSDGRDRRTEMKLAFAVALHYMLERDWKNAARELDDLNSGYGDNPILAFQLSLLTAITRGRVGDLDGQRRALEESVGAVDRARATLRSRTLAYKLGPPRQAIYENLLAVLRRQNDVTAMEKTLARYKRPSAAPLSAVRSASLATRAALAEARHGFDALSRFGLQTKDGDVGVKLFEILVEREAGKRRDPRQGALDAVNRIADTLLSEAVPPEAAPGSGTDLRPGELLLSYFVGTRGVYGVSRTDAGSRRASFTPIKSDELTRLSEKFRRRIEARQDVDQQAIDLYALLLAPLPDLARATHVLLSPDGPLTLLPFQALKRTRTGPYLIETHALTYVNGAARPALAGAPVAGDEVLLIGNPDGKLLTAEAEVNAVTALAGVKASAPLLRSNANLLALRQRLPKARLVHFATHGDFVDAFPNFSYLQLAAGERLYSLDLSGLEFDGRDVFLSACETRLGQVLPGDDVYGVADAFLAAGASTVVATLWRIQSASSAEFAKAYYRWVPASGSSAEALARTARDFIQKRVWVTNGGVTTLLDHPYYWAAYSTLERAGSR